MSNAHILCEYVSVYQLCVSDFRNEKAKSILGLIIFIFLHSISVCYLMFTVSGLKLCDTYILHHPPERLPCTTVSRRGRKVSIAFEICILSLMKTHEFAT